jgi:hypothetical protein
MFYTNTRSPVKLGVLEAEETAEMPLKIGTGERTRSEWFWRTLVRWLAVAAIFAAIRFL